MTREKIKIRQRKIKKALLEQLKRTPTIDLACEKCGVARATVYRWIKNSKKFATEIDLALAEGRVFISSIAESQIFSLIRDKKFEAIRFWLTNNEPRYSNKLEIKGHIINQSESLTPEQEKLLLKALELALPKENYEPTKEQQPEDTEEDGEGSEL
ncbi:MAG: hypothetical protein ABIJ19_00015 [Patescibacteria group bacterium]